MMSRPVAMFACSLFLATIVSGDYRQPLLAGQIQPESVSEIQDPAMTIITLCWQGNDFLAECQKHPTLLRQLLNKLLYKLKMETRRRRDWRQQTCGVCDECCVYRTDRITNTNKRKIMASCL